MTHLKKHLLQLEKEQPGARQTAFYLHIKAAEMFLDVLVKGDATFKAVDTFLRKIWLECCGHLSEFTHQNGNNRLHKETGAGLVTRNDL